MVRQVKIHQRACGRRCHGQMSLSVTGRESQFPLSGQLHGWMSPREDKSVEKDEKREEDKGSVSECGGQNVKEVRRVEKEIRRMGKESTKRCG